MGNDEGIPGKGSKMNTGELIAGNFSEAKVSLEYEGKFLKGQLLNIVFMKCLALNKAPWPHPAHTLGYSLKE